MSRLRSAGNHAGEEHLPQRSRRLTQGKLARQLVRKVGFVRARGFGEPAAADNREPQRADAAARRRHKGRIDLVPPDILVVGHRLLRFNQNDPEVYPEQIKKVHSHTGLDEELQRDLVKCTLDAPTSRIIFYSTQLLRLHPERICAQVQNAMTAIGQPPANLSEYLAARQPTHIAATRKLRFQLARRAGELGDGQPKECLENFVAFLGTWGVAQAAH